MAEHRMPRPGGARPTLGDLRHMVEEADVKAPTAADIAALAKRHNDAAEKKDGLHGTTALTGSPQVPQLPGNVRQSVKEISVPAGQSAIDVLSGNTKTSSPDDDSEAEEAVEETADDVKVAKATSAVVVKKVKSNVRTTPEIAQKTEIVGGYAGKPRFVKEVPPDEGDYERVELVSGFIFYPFKELFVRRVNLPDQFRIGMAQQKRDLTMFLDALDATVSNVDIRDLKVSDFRHLLYWHRLNSYATVQFKINWTSKYGNLNEYVIGKTSLKYISPTRSEEEYQEWQAKGFTLPSVRDMEVFSREVLSEEEQWYLERAQYFEGTPDEDGVVSIESKVEAMQRAGVNAVSQIAEFASSWIYGVDETVYVQDDKFIAVDYMADRRNAIELLRADSQSVENDPILYAGRLAQIEELEEEVQRMQDTLDHGGEVKPDVENIRLNIAPLDFFPNL